MSLERFSCFDLQAVTNTPLEKLENIISALQVKHGVYVFYGNASWFEEGSSSKLRSELGEKLNKKAMDLKPISGQTDNELELSPGLHFISDKVFSLSNPSHNGEMLSFFRSLAGLARKSEIEGCFNKNSFILFAPPILYDFFNTAFESLLGALDNAHEYWLCSDGGLLHTQLIDFPQAWRGNGFAGWRFSECHPYETAEFPYSNAFHEALDKTLEKLHGYEQLLANNHAFSNIRQYRQSGYLHALIDFLPAYRYDNDLIVTNSRWPNEPEGPIVWQGILELDYYQRQLLLDGLLTLWTDRQNPQSYLLQPASLAVLYWAARRLQYTYSAKGTEEFMRRYFDYPCGGTERTCLGWFGGRLKNDRLQVPTEILKEDNQ